MARDRDCCEVSVEQYTHSNKEVSDHKRMVTVQNLDTATQLELS